MFEKIISKSTPEGAGVPIPPRPQSETSTGTGTATSPPPAPGKRNVLGSDVEIQGEVRFEGDLVVGGILEGRIVSDGSLTIGETAQIKAEISCGSVTVRGRVEGNIVVRERVEICGQAEVIGDISADSLSMEAGAVFVGNSTIGKARNTPKIAHTSPQGKEKIEPRSSATGRRRPLADDLQVCLRGSLDRLFFASATR